MNMVQNVRGPARVVVGQVARNVAERFPHLGGSEILKRQEVEKIDAPRLILVEIVIFAPKRSENVLAFVFDASMVTLAEIPFRPTQFLLQGGAHVGKQVGALLTLMEIEAELDQLDIIAVQFAQALIPSPG